MVKSEIEKSKLIWSKKLKGHNVLKMVQEIWCQKKSESKKSLYSKFGSAEAAADGINMKLADVFSKKTSDVLAYIGANRSERFRELRVKFIEETANS